MRQKPSPPAAAAGRLGVAVVGAGSLSTSFIAGVLAVRRGLGKPIGALTQLGRLAGPPERPAPVPVGQAVPLSSLNDLAFGVWDILPDSVYRAAVKARVLDRELLDELRDELDAIRPWKGIFDPRYVHRIQATHCRPRQGHRANVAEIDRDLRSFRETAGIDRMVLLNAASTEAYQGIEEIHSDLKLFERALAADDERISPAMLYSYAALRQRIPVVNFTPSHAVDIPALLQLSEELKVPVAGRGLKTRPTPLQTIRGPPVQARRPRSPGRGLAQTPRKLGG